MLVGGVDVETTGVDFNKDEITELGLVIWDTERAAPVWMFSALRRNCNLNKITPEITKLTGIDAELIIDFGEHDDYIVEHVKKFNNTVECFMAHNASFDYKFMKKHFELNQKPWICSASHIDYPEDKGTARSLNTLAYEHGFINPWRHRAITDVLTMLKVASYHNLHKAKEVCQEEKTILQADFGYRDPDFERIKTEVKEKRFYWKPEQKKWIKEIPSSKVADFVADCSFRVKPLGTVGPLETFEDFSR